MAANGRRRTKGSGGIVHRADGTWEFRREKHVSLDVSRSGLTLTIHPAAMFNENSTIRNFRMVEF